jgi:uncharacterized protein with GYD domain
VLPYSVVVGANAIPCYFQTAGLQRKRRNAMATYLVLGNFTDQGIRAVKDTTKRAEAFKGLAQKAGVKVKDLYWTLGQYDLVITLEAPDEEAVTALGLSAGSLGNVRTQTLRAFNSEEMGRILGKIS